MNHPFTKEKNILVLQNRKDPERKIVVLGTQHMYAPERITDLYEKIIYGFAPEILRPEYCLTKLFSPLRIIQSMLLSKSSNTSIMYKKSLNYFRKKIKRKEKLFEFDAILSKYGILDDKSMMKMSLSKLRITELFKNITDAKDAIDLSILIQFRSIKCRSLDDNVRHPFWNNEVKADFKRNIQIKIEGDDAIIKSITEFLKIVESSRKNPMNDPMYNRSKLNTSFHKLLTRRNRIWYNKMKKDTNKKMVVLVGAAHLRRGPGSLLSLFRNDPDWIAHDFINQQTKPLWDTRDFWKFYFKIVER